MNINKFTNVGLLIVTILLVGLIGMILYDVMDVDRKITKSDPYGFKVVDARFARCFATQVQIKRIHEEINQAAHHGVFSIWVDYEISEGAYLYFLKLNYQIHVNKLQGCTTISW